MDDISEYYRRMPVMMSTALDWNEFMVANGPEIGGDVLICRSFTYLQYRVWLNDTLRAVREEAEQHLQELVVAAEARWFG